MASLQKITPCLWFDNQAEDAAKFYVSIFKDSEMGAVTRYGKEGYEIHHMPEGTAMTVTFRLAGQEFMGLNGGPLFKFSEAISFVVHCDSQAEIDYFWEKLTAGGDPKAQQCGWLKDKFGLSWQISPAELADMMTSGDAKRSGRVMEALLKMKKLDLAELRRAYTGA